MNKLISIITIAFLAVGCSLPIEQSPAPTEPCPVTDSGAPAQPDDAPGVALPTEIQIYTEFSEEEQLGILEAVGAWSDRTYGAAKLNPVLGNDPNHPCQINPVEFLAPVEVHRAGRVLSASGHQCRIELSTSVIKLIDNRKDWNQETQMAEKSDKDVTGVTRVFALKQFGTIFGIPQLETGLMSEYYDKSDDLDDPALEAFCSIHSCPNGFQADAQ